MTPAARRGVVIQDVDWRVCWAERRNRGYTRTAEAPEQSRCLFLYLDRNVADGEHWRSAVFTPIVVASDGPPLNRASSTLSGRALNPSIKAYRLLRPRVTAPDSVRPSSLSRIPWSDGASHAQLRHLQPGSLFVSVQRDARLEVVVEVVVEQHRLVPPARVQLQLVGEMQAARIAALSWRHHVEPE